MKIYAFPSMIILALFFSNKNYTEFILGINAEAFLTNNYVCK